MLIAAVIPRSDTPEQAAYDYGAVVFLVDSVQYRGRKVGEWLRTRRGEHNGYAFEIPDLQESVSWRRYPSHTSYEYIGLPWPFAEYPINGMEAPGNRDPSLASIGYLASDRCPFFPDYQTAAFQLLYPVASVEPGRPLPGQIVSVLIAHTEAWIESVHFFPSSVTVTIEGSNVMGTRLEAVGSPSLRWEAKPARPDDYTCPLPNGSPSNLWIVLSRNGLRLDYRYLNQLWSPFSPKIENVTIEPPDTGTRLEQLIYRGEGETIEFKREIPPKKHHDRLLKTVAAFANGQGGTILLGVDKDEDKTIVGVNDPVNTMKDQLTNMIRDNLVPEQRIRLDDVEISGKPIIAIEVERGDAPPYGLHADKPIFYVRRGATTFVARQDEVRALGHGGQSGDTRLHGLIG